MSPFPMIRPLCQHTRLQPGTLNAGFFYQLPYLLKFQVAHNRMHGTIPHVEARNLLVFDGSYNNFTGFFPETFFFQYGSTNLQVINLAHNNLIGMPYWFYLKNQVAPGLRKFDISYNSFEGSCPIFPPPTEDINDPNYWLSKQLRWLDLSGNFLVGTAPVSVWPNLSVHTSLNCFKPPAKFQRPASVCKALLGPHCEAPYQFDMQCSKFAGFNITQCSSVTFDSTTGRCNYFAYEDGTTCQQDSNGGCTSYKCKAGQCNTIINVNRTCTGYPGGDQLCYKARCDDGTCQGKYNNRTDCIPGTNLLFGNNAYYYIYGYGSVGPDLHPLPKGDACNLYTCGGDFSKSQIGYCQNHAAPATTPCLNVDKCTNVYRCKGGQCNTVRIHPNGSFCDVNTAGATAIDPRCQINGCSNGQCTKVVSTKPVGSVCHPSFLTYDNYHYTGGETCSECCAHCNAAGSATTTSKMA
eukprot:SM000077S21625  [mRNA]  locus=s77:612308:618045:- [translate_table: standard]